MRLKPTRQHYEQVVQLLKQGLSIRDIAVHNKLQNFIIDFHNPKINDNFHYCPLKMDGVKN